MLSSTAAVTNRCTGCLHTALQVRLKLRTQLTSLRPVEVVLPRRGSESMTAVTSRLCRCGGSKGLAPALNELPASSADAAAAVEVRLLEAQMQAAVRMAAPRGLS